MRQQQPDAIAAYRTLAAISNLNDYHVMLLNAIQHAQFQR